MNYLCKESWKRHTKGDVITDWEYRKLPPEIKKHFELVDDVRIEVLTIEEEILDTAVIEEKIETVEVGVPRNPFSPKKKKFEATADIDKIIDDTEQEI